METSYFLLLQDNIRDTNDGAKLESSDLIVVTSRKNIKTQNLIGVLTVDHKLATVTFRKSNYFGFLEKIEKIFNVEKFIVNVNPDLESSSKKDRETTVKTTTTNKIQVVKEEDVFDTPAIPQTEEKLEEKTATESENLEKINTEDNLTAQESSKNTEIKVCTKHLNQTFACPFLVDEDKDTKQAFNCLIPEKQCPLVVQCKKPVFFPVLQSYLDFQEYDFYRFDFENNDHEYSLGITKTGAMSLTKRA